VLRLEGFFGIAPFVLPNFVLTLCSNNNFFCSCNFVSDIHLTPIVFAD
jgi:hypothetical protein